MARGEILVFTDDDIIAAPHWLAAIDSAFSDRHVALVGGKILPRWEGDVPAWIDFFKSELEPGWALGHLSLLDYGDSPREMPASYVYGCNFAVRRSVLYECGGFHPDSVPQELIQFRGDGETALAGEIEKKGYRVFYEPEATVYHRVPSERITVEYFCKRAFNQGVSDSYTEIRKNGGVLHMAAVEEKQGFVSRLLSMRREHPIRRQVRQAYLSGKEFHRKSVEADPELLRYVLKETYF
jgi:hypothetical protein